MELKAGAQAFALDRVEAPGPALDVVRELFLEYARSLDFSLCFQGFEQELATLPGDYAPPRGCLLLARFGSAAAGCVGVRPLDRGRCEMKRLYVRPPYRGTGAGRRLAEAAIATARAAGYSVMLLDTLAQMRVARTLYDRLGFRPCEPYYDNSPIGSECLVLRLEPAVPSPQPLH